MERVLAELNLAWDRLAGEATALESVADRWLGEAPSEANACTQPAPTSMVEHFDVISNRLQAMADRLQQARKRLERL